MRVELSLCSTFLDGIALKRAHCTTIHSAQAWRDRPPRLTFSLFVVLIDHLFKFLHGQDTHRLACRLGFEDARLFREWINAFAGRGRRLLLELEVQDASEFETAVFLQLIR